MTFGGVVKVGVHGRASDDVVEGEDHCRHVLFQDLIRVVGIDLVGDINDQF